MLSEPSKPSTDPQDDDNNVRHAASRLAQEVRQAVTFGLREIKDVTVEFLAAAQQLPGGQLVKDEYFTLFEAVSALEIMDSKMDSGYVSPGDSFMPDFDPCQALAADEVLWIMDQLLSLEIAWYDGYPLSQSVYTSLHVDRLLAPDSRPPYMFSPDDDAPPSESRETQLVHRVLHAYCVALIKCCEHALHLVQSQNFYEEEDFSTHLFGRELLPKTTASNAFSLLEEAMTWLGQVSSSDRALNAVATRIRFRSALLTCLANGGDWRVVLGALKDIEESHHLGRAVPPAFSDKVQRCLATSTPPRPALQLCWPDSIAKWRSMCSDFLEAYRLTDLWVLQSPHCLQRATWAFAYRSPPPNTFARANLQDVILGSDRITQDVSHFDLLLTDIRDLVLAGDQLADVESFQIELPSDPRHQCSRLIEAFMDRALDEYVNIYRVVCQNRCRIRRLFAQAIAMFDKLEAEALKTDGKIEKVYAQPLIALEDGQALHLNPLTCWTKYYRLMIMTWTLQLGFETDIYLPDELRNMYWLLSNIAQSRCMLLQHITSFLMIRMQKATMDKMARQAAECLASADWLRSLTAVAEVSRVLALALWRLYSLLMDLGVIKDPKRDLATDQLLYEARLKPFLRGVLRDPIPSAEEFAQAQQIVQSVQTTCDLIGQDIKLARARLAELKKMSPQEAKYVGTEDMWKRELKQLETTCVAVAVQTSQLLRIHDQQKAAQHDNIGAVFAVILPVPGTRYADLWIVPTVSSALLMKEDRGRG